MPTTHGSESTLVSKGYVYESAAYGKREPAKSRTPRVRKPKAKRAPKTFGRSKR